MARLQSPNFVCKTDGEVVNEFGKPAVEWQLDTIEKIEAIFGVCESPDFVATKTTLASLPGFGPNGEETVKIRVHKLLEKSLVAAFTEVKNAKIDYELWNDDPKHPQFGGQLFRYKKNKTTKKYLKDRSEYEQLKQSMSLKDWEAWGWAAKEAAYDSKNGKLGELIEIGGGKKVTKKSLLSNHAWGTAIDLNSGFNDFKEDARFDMNKKIIEILAKYGFRWGGYYHDYMHFEYVLNKKPDADQMGLIFPVDIGNGLNGNSENIKTYYTHTEKDTEGGYFPVGSNTLWHGGLHIFKDEGTEVFACMPGKVIAGRLADDASLATGPFGHRNFLLLEHEIKEKKCYSLYMHLKDNPLSDSDEFVKKVKWLQGGGKKSYKITGDTRNYRSSPDSSSDANKLGSLKKGDVVELVEDASPAPWKKVKLSDGKEVFLSCDPKFVEECSSAGVDTDLLESLKKGDVVKIDKDIQAGDLLWKMGKFGPKTDQKGLVHWEIFSEENIIETAGISDWTSVEDPDDDFNAENETITQLFGDLMTDGTLTREELKQFYAEDPEGKVEKLRSFACKFASEWGVKDLSAAISELKRMGFAAKEDEYKPYLWWPEAVSAGVKLPSEHVWHYNPVKFLEVFGQSTGAGSAQGSPAATTATSATVGVKKCEGPETVDVLEKGTYKVTEFSGTPSDEQKKNVNWIVYINGEERKKFEKCGETLEFEIPDTWAGDEILVHPYINKPSPDLKVTTKVGPYFLFDGKELAIYNVKCAKGISWQACSGENGVTDSSKEHGPIPDGKYLIEKSNVQDLPGMMDRMGDKEWDGGEDYWGKKRIQVFSFGAKTFGRTRFYIHGGKKMGSGFGIDLTDKIEEMISFVNAFKRDKIVLVVKATSQASKIPQATDNVHTDWKLGFNRDISKQNEYNDLIYKYTKDTTINPYIFKSLIAQESAFKKEAHNKMGYAGLTQIGNSTIADSGLKIAGTKRVTQTVGKEVKKVWEYDLENDERFKPEKSIEGGVKILKRKITCIDQNVFKKYTTPPAEEEKWKFYLAAYNGGEGTIKKAYIACKVTNATWDDIIKGKESSALWGAIPEAWGREGKYKEISTYPLEILKRATQDGSVGASTSAAGASSTTSAATPSTTESAKTEALKKGNYDDVAVKKYPSKKASGTGHVTGSQVEKLQKDLTAVGFTEIGTADGDFGQKTEDCVKKFQEYALKNSRYSSNSCISAPVTFKGTANGVADKTTLDELALWVSKGYKIPQDVQTASGDYRFPLATRPTLSYKKSAGHKRWFGADRKSEKNPDVIRYHAGCDLIADPGTVIYAVADGTIISYKNFYMQTYYLQVDHGEYTVRYGEIQPPKNAYGKDSPPDDISKGLPNNLKAGAKVKKGDQIAYVGQLREYDKEQKKYVNKSHMLHFELYKGSVTTELTDESNSKHYDNVTAQNYMRAKQLLDPTKFLDDCKDK
jgi:peptidoglycan hydrolase-like protein with peptidoglycan-binding domain